MVELPVVNGDVLGSDKVAVTNTVVVRVYEVDCESSLLELLVASMDVLVDVAEPGSAVSVQVGQVVHGEGFGVHEEIDEKIPVPLVTVKAVELEMGNQGVFALEVDEEGSAVVLGKVVFGV